VVAVDIRLFTEITHFGMDAKSMDPYDPANFVPLQVLIACTFDHILNNMV
jgi:hypothetical protein